MFNFNTCRNGVSACLFSLDSTPYYAQAKAMSKTAQKALLSEYNYSALHLGEVFKGSKEFYLFGADVIPYIRYQEIVEKGGELSKIALNLALKDIRENETGSPLRGGFIPCNKTGSISPSIFNLRVEITKCIGSFDTRNYIEGKSDTTFTRLSHKSVAFLRSHALPLGVITSYLAGAATVLIGIS